MNTNTEIEYIKQLEDRKLELQMNLEQLVEERAKRFSVVNTMTHFILGVIMFIGISYFVIIQGSLQNLVINKDTRTPTELGQLNREIVRDTNNKFVGEQSYKQNLEVAKKWEEQVAYYVFDNIEEDIHSLSGGDGHTDINYILANELEGYRKVFAEIQQKELNEILYVYRQSIDLTEREVEEYTPEEVKTMDRLAAEKGLKREVHYFWDKETLTLKQTYIVQTQMVSKYIFSIYWFEGLATEIELLQIEK